MNKLKLHDVKSIRFSNITEKILEHEKNTTNLFIGFFDYLQFIKVYNKTLTINVIHNKNINKVINEPNQNISKNFEDIMIDDEIINKNKNFLNKDFNQKKNTDSSNYGIIKL